MSGRAAIRGGDNGTDPMLDLLWLAILGGLVALTLAFVRLCDGA
ncbi:hypothetical protein [Sphingomonas sp. MS122]